MQMKLSQSEREALTGPAVVGVVLGLLGVLCTLAFNSEYRPAALSGWALIVDALLVFGAGVLLALMPFGVAPVLIARFNARPKN
ncbi:MAG TPA: hypothetical protein VGC21_00600 [Telluria sp.]